jgi:hypothetical protein
MTPSDIIQSFSAAITAIGVVVAAYQLFEAKKQAQLQFEDSLNAQYRALLEDLPLDALLGRTLSDDELERTLHVFYRYFDLSNEQRYLRRCGRVSTQTWETWQEGIAQNMARPAFQQAWLKLLPDLDGSFDDLRQSTQKPPLKPSSE